MKFSYSTFNNSPGKFILIEGLNGSGKTTQAKILVKKLKKRGVKAVFNHEPTQGTFGQLIRLIIEEKKKTKKEKEFLNKLVKQVEKKDIFSRNFKSKLILLLKQLQKIPLGHPLILEELGKQTLFVADRLEDLYYNIFPLLKKGFWIVQDRYDLSGYVHGFSQGLNYYQLRKIHQYLGKFYLAPDIIFYYWLPAKEAFLRLKKSGKILDCYENLKNLERIEKIAKNFLDFSEKYFQNQKFFINFFSIKDKKNPFIAIDSRQTIKKVSEKTFSLLEKFFPIKFCNHTSVGVILRNSQGKILLIDRKIFPFYFACPAGHLKRGEKPLEGAKREVKEETGLEIFNLKLVLKKKFKNPCSKINGFWHQWWVFQADFQGKLIPSEEEVKNIGWFSSGEIKNLGKQKKLEPVWQEIFKDLDLI